MAVFSMGYVVRNQGIAPSFSLNLVIYGSEFDVWYQDSTA